MASSPKNKTLVLLATSLLLTYNYSVSACASQELKELEKARAKEIGTKEIEFDGKDAFYFYHGQYMERPYTLRRDGYQLFFNGKQIFRFPTVPRNYQEKKPVFPDEINAKSSWEDVEKILVDHKRWYVIHNLWYYSHYGPENIAEQLSNAYQKFPFVKSVTWVPTPNYGKDHGLLRVESKKGDIREFFTGWWNPERKAEALYPVVRDLNDYDFRPFSVNKVQGNLNGRIKSKENIIKSGSIMFTAANGSIRIPKTDNRWKNIVDVVAILKSDASNKIKADEIYPLVVSEIDQIKDQKKRQRTNDWMIIKTLVRNFKNHPQLDKRIAALKQKYDVPDWVQPVEPPMQKIPEHLKDDPRLTPQGTIREAIRLLESNDYKKLAGYIGSRKNYNSSEFEKGMDRLVDIYKLPQGVRRSNSNLMVRTKGKMKNSDLLLAALKNVVNKKPRIDDIDDVAEYDVDIPGLVDTASILGKLVPLRKTGHLWVIGF